MLALIIDAALQAYAATVNALDFNAVRRRDRLLRVWGRLRARQLAGTLTKRQAVKLETLDKRITALTEAINVKAK